MYLKLILRRKKLKNTGSSTHKGRFGYNNPNLGPQGFNDISHNEDEACADCFTILGQFHEFNMTFALFELVSGASVYSYVSCVLLGVLNMKLRRK
jgi:hypothetical protein